MIDTRHPDATELESYCAALLSVEDDLLVRSHIRSCALCKLKVQEIVRRNLSVAVQ